MRSDRVRLEDIISALDEVAEYLPVDRAAFDSNPPLQSHIYRHVMIVGEAAWCLSKTLKDQHRHIPWKQIEGMRHIMVHDYFKVDWDIVFNTAHKHLPVPRPQVEAILKSLPPEPLPL
jgi:uncharacterized protein with HEPN domain